MESGKDKDKKKNNNQRFLSPSYKKGLVKEKQDEDFQINLISNDEEDLDDTKTSPKSKPIGSKRWSWQDDPHVKAAAQKKRRSVVEGDITVWTDKAKQMTLIPSHIKKFANYSQAGKGEDGFTKVNQDAYFSIPNQYKWGDFNMFSVMDGHGMNGHWVSGFCTKFFKKYFAKNKKLNIWDTEKDVYDALKKGNYEIIRHVFKKAEREISKSDIDANFSGTTCVMLFQLGDKLICANTGDSRCIMVKENNEIVELSIDQKPNNEVEYKRIMKMGGEVSQYEEDGVGYGPYRVWKKGEQYPGIAMSRSIGDLFASTLGVIPEPELIEVTLEPKTKFIVLASDGVWEFLDNKTVRDLVIPFYKKNDPDGACKLLIQESTTWWNKEDVVVDDITVIVIFFLDFREDERDWIE